MEAQRYFLSENCYYEIDIEDYFPNREVTNEEWQRFADRLGEEFKKIDANYYDDDYEKLWYDAHQKVCVEFQDLFN